MLTGATGVVATVLFYSNQFLGLGLGTMERIAVYPLILSAIGTGLGWFASVRQRRPATADT